VKRRLPPVSIKTVAVLVVGIAASSALGLDTYDLSWHTVDGGGIQVAGGGAFVLAGTIGQHDAGGPLVGGSYSLIGGFWTVDATIHASCPEDLDASGTVDAADLAILLGNWGAAGVGDIDGSGTVDASDLAQLLGAWGTC
jgi:hypothetical protein